MSRENKVAVVTGAARGIGLACAQRLRRDGIRVVTLDRDGGCDHLVDVADEEAVAAARDEIGPVDILVNSAGVVGPSAPFTDIPRSAWASTLGVNFFGTVTVMQAFAPDMVEQGWGRIVNVASIAGKEGNPFLAPYSASKGAVIAMTKSVGKELATSGVLVNAIAPAVISTSMNEATAPDVLAHVVSLIPMKRPGTAEEVAELTAWLSSEMMTFSTGAIFDLSGGRATY